MKICLQKKKNINNTVFRIIVIKNKKKSTTGRLEDILGIFWIKNKKNRELSINLMRLIYWFSHNNIKISKKSFILISNFII